MTHNTSVKFSGYSIFAGNLQHITTDKKFIVNTLNQYSYTVAEEDPEFKQALLNSDILLPDGIGVTVAVGFLKKRRIKKIAGADIHQHLLAKLNESGGRCFYLGARDETLELIRKKLGNEFPDITVGYYSPPYKATFSTEDTQAMLDAVNLFKPDVLFVGMTAPKQEKWIYQNQASIDSNVICAIGAVFDFYAGTVDRPSKYWQAFGLEWLVRLVKEPKRMYKRYLYYGPVFILQLLKIKYKIFVDPRKYILETRKA
jgi:N-acetylglucosaminyldiphosphoundecaprenol N-acetyl-beta-D-mannosaminyltransferase